MGGESIDDDVVRSLLGAPARRGPARARPTPSRSATPARRSRSSSRLVQDGQDIRNVTAEASRTSATSCSCKTAPGQDDLLDIQADGYEQLRVQAEKFTPGEIARVIALLLAAQNDMRWTTSPRLSLELALVRATIPETDPNPAGVVARLERLERLANLDVASASGVAPAGGASDAATIPVLAPSELRSSGSPLTAAPPTVDAPEEATPAAHDAEGGVARRGDPEERSREAASTAMSRPERDPDRRCRGRRGRADGRCMRPMRGRVDVAMLRRGWPSLMEHLQSTRKMILKASLESATVGDVRRGDAGAGVPAGEDVHGREGHGPRGGAAAGARGPVRDPPDHRLRGARGAGYGRGADVARDRRGRGSAVGRGGARGACRRCSARR